jgi:ABC-type multidrug transport system ATPase subunit
MPGRFSLYHDLTVEENLRFFATAFKTTVEENYDLVKDIYSHIEPFKKRLAGKLSGGMKQKLALSCALIHRPKILVLDEPTTGVDAVSRKEFWEMLKKLQLSGITIVVSTPYMDEAGLCDRVALMEKGRIMAVDTPAAITGRFAKKIYAVTSDHIYALSKEVNKFPATQSAWLFGQDLHVTGSENFSSDELLQYLATKGFSDVKIRESEPVIEDCFLELMKQTNQAL